MSNGNASAIGDEPYSTKRFYLEDYPRTLFPLNTNKILMQHGEGLIRDRVSQIVSGGGSFQAQIRVFAAKDALHLRRTVKLDVVAEYYIYDLMYRNRSRMRKPHHNHRKHYGYRFEDGAPIPPSRSYSEFKHEIWMNNIISANFIGFDVASYFNSLYHHDLVEWFAATGAEKSDCDSFDKYLREINSGRSLDCLPQGIYPTKMIGSDFLRFIEESHAVRSSVIVRFMDDVYMFSDDVNELSADFMEVQRLLGQKALTVNPGKTTNVMPRTQAADTGIDELKKKLLVRRRSIVTTSLYDEGEFNPDDDVEEEEERGGHRVAQGRSVLNLSREEIAYVKDLLSQPNLEEDDAELILTVMRNNANDIKYHIPEIAQRFPHLAKHIFHFCAEIGDKEAIAEMVLGLASSTTRVQEYQLFWLGMMLDEYLMGTTKAAAIIHALFQHPNATPVTQAKVLEIGDLRYGLAELRQPYLTSGQSDWLSWSSGVGARTMDRAARNYRLSYMKHSSPMNALVSEIVSGI